MTLSSANSPTLTLDLINMHASTYLLEFLKIKPLSLLASLKRHNYLYSFWRNSNVF